VWPKNQLKVWGGVSNIPKQLKDILWHRATPIWPGKRFGVTVKFLFFPVTYVFSRLSARQTPVLLTLCALIPFYALTYSYIAHAPASPVSAMVVNEVDGGNAGQVGGAAQTTPQGLGSSFSGKQGAAGESASQASAPSANRIAFYALVHTLFLLYVFGGFYLAGRQARVAFTPVIASMAGGDYAARLDPSLHRDMGWVACAVNRINREHGRANARMAQAVDELNNVAVGLSDLVRVGTQNAEHQGSAMSVIASSIEEMVTSIRQIEEQSNSASITSEMASTLATEGEEIANNVVDEISRIEDESTESAQLIGTLGERSRQVGTIIEVINEISEQTNLLALNAAIEAARAGDHGRGFSVVADEVRTLADRTRTATTEVTEQIEKIQAEVNQAILSISHVTGRVSGGVELTQKAGQSLTDIKQGALDTVEMIKSITEAISQQGSASDEIAASAEQMSVNSHEFNGMISEIESTAVYLSQLSNRLQANSGG
jgi:methyl-accepting chemotaxis protein